MLRGVDRIHALECSLRFLLVAKPQQRLDKAVLGVRALRLQGHRFLQQAQGILVAA